MRTLILTDSLNLPTGQGRVGREIAFGLRSRGHEIGYLGLFQHQDVPAPVHPGIKCWFTNNNLYGADMLDNVVNRFQPDAVLTIGDFWNLWYIANQNSCKTRKYFTWSSYIPCDGEPICGGLPPGIVPTVEDIDLPVAYTNYARDCVLKSCFDQETRNRLRVIYHGVNTAVYRPAQSPAQRQAVRNQYGIGDKFMFLTVSRNQSRKNIPELFRAWKKFSELPEVRGKVVFWPHMYFNDPMGWNIDELLGILDLRNDSIMYYNQVAHSSSELMLIPELELAALYQVADAFILLSGEGFGLPTFEAMATKLPCILLDYAASSELGAEGRSELVPIKGSLTWTGAHLTQRPIPDVDRTVQAMLNIYRNREYRDFIAGNGYEFATKFTWDAVNDQWNSLFLGEEIPFMRPRELEVIT